MEQQEYKPSQGQQAVRRPGGRGMGRGAGERAKDFTGTWKKLLLYCRKYFPLILVAIVCAIVQPDGAG